MLFLKPLSAAKVVGKLYHSGKNLVTFYRNNSFELSLSNAKVTENPTLSEIYILTVYDHSKSTIVDLLWYDFA